jgi:elongation factor P--beta-lysine ligase
MSLYQLLCSRLNLVQLTHIFYKHPFLRYVYIPLQKAADQVLQQQAQMQALIQLQQQQYQQMLQNQVIIYIIRSNRMFFCFFY